jgi:hypothetical protein
MNIPESILEPFGYTGIPLIRLKCSPESIEATLIRLMGHLRGFASEDIKDSLECAVLILGANGASCYIHRSNYPDEIGDDFTLRYILANDDQTHSVHLNSGAANNYFD